MVTDVTPRPTMVPAAGDCVYVNAPVAVQLSVTVTDPVKSGSGDVQVLEVVNPDCGGAHAEITGAVLSVTVTVCVHIAILPLPSVTVQVTIVVPTG